MSPVELRRIVSEWRLRVQRVKDILQPPAWDETEWRRFSQTLALLVRDHGRSWIIDPNVYWDLRWKLQDGGDLVCQVEHIPGEKTSLVVAQTGGFASATEGNSYTWLWAEFDLEGNFSRDPYWVDGAWKEALTTLLLPFDRQSSYLLAGRTETPDALLLQEGARPNDGQYHLPLPAGYHAENGQNGSPSAEAAPEDITSVDESISPPIIEPQAAEPPPASPPMETSVEGPMENAPASEPMAPANEAGVRDVQPEIPVEEIIPATIPGGQAARHWRQSARIRHARSARKIPPRSYYRKSVAKPH
jgi:hypothetical protein